MVASERHGHSKIGITLDLDSQVLPNMRADAAAIVDDALRAALNNQDRKGSILVAATSYGGPGAVRNARYIGLSRVSSAVEQRFCKPLVGSSILSPGTTK
jgi:hypothetical protein